MQIIPAIDLMDGKAVRLRQGDFGQTTIYPTPPLDLAKKFEAVGLRRLHIVDLDGARLGCPRHLKLLEKIAAATDLQIDFGGGFREIQNLRDAANAGANWLTVGSIAVLEPEIFAEWLAEFSPEKFLVGADVRDEKLAVRGWQEQTELGLFDFLETLKTAGIRQIFVTDIARDGVLAGPATALYEKILVQFPDFQLIASGGISNFEDFQILKNAGCAGAIVGKAFYEGHISITQMADFLKVHSSSFIVHR